MPLTLVEASKLNSGDVVKSTVIEMFAQSSDILRVLPFESITGGAVKYDREQTLPGVAFRGVNESYSESTGVMNPIVDSTYIVGGDADVDKYIVETRGQNVRAAHVRMKVKSLADTWTTKFFKGDNTSDPREFDGLQSRLTGGQLIDAGSTSNGDALSLSILDAAIDAVDEPTHIAMSKAMRRLLSAAARTPAVSGYVTYSLDEFGRRVMEYNGLPIVVAYSNNGGTEPLGFTEANPGGGTSTGTSIYVLSLGVNKLNGIQNGTMDVRDLGELNDAPTWRTRIEWYAGLALYHGRAAARLRGIKNAAVVA